ncbi:MAG: hypothetical protein LBU89_03035 [Fibromonadaceae bacterium]|nr:hypothetical protein [Fibromonadaceae bacterium]
MRVEANSYTFTIKDGRTVEVHYALPAKINNNTKILFALHGASRITFIEAFKFLAKTDNIVVIAPAFSEEQFSEGHYQEIGIDGNIDTPENWTSKIIDDIFLDFKKRYDLSNNKYILTGHSAGGQFAHRAVMFSESNYLDYAIASGAGQYTFPDYEVNYGLGIKNLPIHKDLIHKNFGRRLYILVGDLDNDPDCHCLPRSELLERQGFHRLERAENFYQASKDYCEQNNLFFNWELIIMENTTHALIPSVPYYVRSIIRE